MEELRGKSVFITGAASGIGKATAISFATEGASPIVITDVNAEGLADTSSRVEAAGSKVICFELDVADSEGVNRVIEDVLDRVVRLDVLVNVAGWGLMCPMEDLILDDWKKAIDINLIGLVNTVSAVYPHMLRNGSGHIANVASSGGLFVMGLYGAPYFASKFGAVGFSEALMLEAAQHGIGVTCVCPGAVKTPIVEKGLIKGFRPESRKLGRFLWYIAESPDDTARSLVNAVKKNRFLVVTTPYYKAAYFMRRHIPWLWFSLIGSFTKLNARLLRKYHL